MASPSTPSLDQLVDRVLGLRLPDLSAASPVDPDAASFSGQDPTGAVTVTVDPTGRLLAIVVLPAWSGRLASAADLVGAVRLAHAEAYSLSLGLTPDRSAMQSFDPTSVDAWLEEQRDLAQSGGGAPTRDWAASPEIQRSLAEQRATYAEPRDTDALVAELAEVMDRLRTLDGPAEPDDTTTTVGDGQLRLVLDGGRLVDLELDERWAGQQSGNTLTMRIAAIIAQQTDQQEDAHE